MAPRQLLYVAVLLMLALMAQKSSAQSSRVCGGAGQACCCAPTAWQGPRCCSTGLQCTMFGGEGFGTPPVIQSLCLEKSSKACGNEGGPCCVAANSNGYASGSCSTGLKCIPGPTAFGSKAMFNKLSGGYTAAARDTSVTGTCRKATACNTAFNPCGKAAGCGSAACPSGFYCAASFDSGVGDICLPLPANAGKAGGPCLPNNLPGAPVVQSQAINAKVAAPFCDGSAVCFTPTGGDATGFSFDRPGEAKELATRISGTRCVEVPADCGTGVGSTCCPSTYNMVTDKPLPSAAWGGAACNPKVAEHGTYCAGSYAVLGGQPIGTCAANRPCGGPDQPCCRYSKVDMAGVNCPNLGGPGKGYCTLGTKCRLCPKVLYSVEDILRCY